jgi:hypothetical protein
VGLAMENLGIFYDHLVYFAAIGNILWPYGIFVVIWYIIPRFGTLDQEKSGNPGLDHSNGRFISSKIFVTFRNINLKKNWDQRPVFNNMILPLGIN